MASEKDPSNPVVESMLRNPKVSELKLTKVQLEGVLAAIGECVREVLYKHPENWEMASCPGYARYVIGGWLEVQAISSDRPLVKYTPSFLQEAADDQKVYVDKFNDENYAKDD
jgi:hypothetical protein